MQHVVEVNVPSMRSALKVVVVPAALCSLGYLRRLRIRGNASPLILEVPSTENAVCFLSGMDYRNKRLSLCFGERQDGVNA